MRWIVLVFLLVVSVGAVAVAWGALSNLWADYQDSPAATYLLVGLPALTLCLAALMAAASIWRQR
jgi:hypothetical protein